MSIHYLHGGQYLPEEDDTKVVLEVFAVTLDMQRGPPTCLPIN